MAIGYELLEEQGVTERCELIFDQNDRLAPQVKRWYPWILDNMESHARAIMPIDPLFRNDAEFVPLQASDLLAWVMRREASGLDHTFDWIPEAMHGLTWSGHRQTFDRERMLSIREQSLKREITHEELERQHRILGLGWPPKEWVDDA
jgi:hypothetical protein